jgi:hypothetical protein
VSVANVGEMMEICQFLVTRDVGGAIAMHMSLQLDWQWQC